MADLHTINRDITILVVDDQPLTRTMIKSILKGLGFATVLQAENGNTAMNRIQSEPIDLIICDWNMPLVSGIDVLRMLRNNPATRKLPFLMLTAEAYRENVSAAIEAGVDGYIAKPFTPEVLAEKIVRVLTDRAAG